MLRRVVFAVIAALLFLLVIAAPRVAHADTVTLRIATLAPAASPWGKVFKAWQKGIKDQSNGALELEFFYGNQQGDEVAMVGKMRTRQLDGAAITATGLAQIYKSVLVLQMPGLFHEWGALDSARGSMRPELDAAFEKEGFLIAGWGDVGIAHLMTKGFEVHTPADLKHKNAFYLAGDPIESTFYQVVGDVNPKQLTVPEILPALTAGTINIVNAPALAAEQLQWSSLLDHINTSPSGIGIGALVFTASKINSLPADLKKLVLESGNSAGAALTQSIRNQDAAAFGRLKARMSAYEPTAAESDAWKALFKQTRDRLRGSTFEPKIFDESIKLAGVQ
jgi:TRAP-type C4-dicarboxylate transport system substrate-binding protein